MRGEQCRWWLDLCSLGLSAVNCHVEKTQILKTNSKIYQARLSPKTLPHLAKESLSAWKLIRRPVVLEFVAFRALQE